MLVRRRGWGESNQEGESCEVIARGKPGQQTSSVLCLVDCARRCEVVLLATPDGHREIVLAVFLVAGDGTDGIGERKLPWPERLPVRWFGRPRPGGRF